MIKRMIRMIAMMVPTPMYMGMLYPIAQVFPIEISCVR
jgi:hypothetical protein